jgi:hypothetical protein
MAAGKSERWKANIGNSLLQVLSKLIGLRHLGQLRNYGGKVMATRTCQAILTAILNYLCRFVNWQFFDYVNIKVLQRLANGPIGCMINQPSAQNRTNLPTPISTHSNKTRLDKK